MYRIVRNKKDIVAVRNKKLALFGGSFDPFHTTHLDIAKYVYMSCNVDYVVLIPTKQNPFKDSQSLIDTKKHIAMICSAINNYQHILIDDFELVSDAFVSYTYFTLEHIKNMYSPSMPLQLVIGSDIFVTLNKWKNIQQILEWVTLVVIPRKNYDITIPKCINEYAGSIQILKDFPMTDISSSVIREQLYGKNNKNVLDLKKVLPLEVHHYI